MKTKGHFASNSWISLVLAGGLSALSACSESASEKEQMGVKDTGPEETLYTRLGGSAAIQTVVGDFVTRVVGDSKINGYFLNSSLDADKLKGCLVKQIGEATGGPEKYDCRSMKATHEGLGISKQDFDDLVAHLSDALGAANVAQADIDTILGVLGPMAADIVEDPTNDMNIYQRVGRKPAIQTVIGKFHENITADTRVNHFFANTVAERLGTCLVRQVCGATGGPCKYGEEIPNAEPGVIDPCRDMKESHTGLGIAKADFDALVEDLVKALNDSGVPAADQDTILGVLGPMCPDIVEVGACQ